MKIYFKSLVVYFFLLICFFSCQEPLTTDQLFDKYYVSPISQEEGRYTDNPENTVVDRLYYNAHESILNANGFSSKLFERLSLDDADKYKEEADWFLALSLIKEGRIEEAKTRLNTITNFRNHKYEMKSKELLKLL